VPDHDPTSFGYVPVRLIEGLNRRQCEGLKSRVRLCLTARLIKRRAFGLSTDVLLSADFFCEIKLWFKAR